MVIGRTVSSFTCGRVPDLHQGIMHRAHYFLLSLLYKYVRKKQAGQTHNPCKTNQVVTELPRQSFSNHALKPQQ